MAKKRNLRPEIKPQDSQKVNEILEHYNQLSAHDRGVFLQRAGVFYLHHRFQPLHPTTELRRVINNLSRLSYLINTMMHWATIRRIDVNELAVISRSRLEEDTIQPVLELLQERCRKIEGILFNDSPDSSSGAKSGEKHAESGSGEKQVEEAVPQTDDSDDDNVFGLNTADEN